MVKPAVALLLMTCGLALAQAQPQPQLPSDGQEIDIDLNAPTPVTLHIPSTQASAIVEAIAPGGEIRFYGPAKPPKASLDVDNEPLLSALAKLSVATGASPVSSWPREAPLQLQVQPKSKEQLGSMMSAPISYSGPFAIVLTELTSTQSLRVITPEGGGDESKRTISFSVSLFTEPKVAVAAIVPYAEMEEASDAAGTNYVEPNRNQNYSWNPHNAPPVYQFNGNINGVPRDTDKLALLKGYLRIRAVKKCEAHVLTPVEGKSSTFKLGDATCTLEPLQRQGTTQSRLSIKVPRAGQDDPGWEAFQQMARGSRAIAFDAAGRRLGEFYRNFSQASDSVTLHLQLNQTRGANPPQKVIWYGPLEVEELTVPFEFKDVPTPY